MPRYVALFRGINVGKAKRIAMADLRVLLGKLGGHFRPVRVRPGHEEDRPGPMLRHGLTVLPGVLVEGAPKLRVHRALAAVRHDDRIKGRRDLGRSRLGSVDR